MTELEIWGRTGCSFCNKAKFLCDSKEVGYTYYQLGEDFTREELLEQFPTAQTFPQIRFVDKAEFGITATRYIGGFTELKEYLP